MTDFFRLAALAAVAALSLSACATVTTGADQTISVVTDPSGAECRLDRGNSTIAIVNPTPGTVLVDKSKDAILVRCQSEGYQETAANLSSEFQGATIGNVLLGGLIGVAIDAGSGAMNKYPEQVTLLLIPASFSSAEERDRFFDGAIERTRNRGQVEIAKVKAACPEDSNCDREIKLVERAVDIEIGNLRSKWAAAKIAS